MAPASLLARMDHTRSSPAREGGAGRTDARRSEDVPWAAAHLQALQRANAVRLARAELKRRVADGEVSAAEVILRSPWEAESMTVSDLLTSQRRWGSTRCRKFLQCDPDLREQDDRVDDRAPATGARPAAARRRGRPVAADVTEERAEALRPVLAGVA